MAEHILVVDDEPAIRNLVGQLLNSSGYHVAFAGDGFDALLNIREHPPDLMISDLRMPRMSGFELLSIVRRRFPEMPVITNSSDYDPLFVPPCVICDAYFQKGEYKTPELLAKVGELLEADHRAALPGYPSPGVATERPRRSLHRNLYRLPTFIPDAPNGRTTRIA